MNGEERGCDCGTWSNWWEIQLLYCAGRNSGYFGQIYVHTLFFHRTCFWNTFLPNTGSTQPISAKWRLDILNLYMTLLILSLLFLMVHYLTHTMQTRFHKFWKNVGRIWNNFWTKSKFRVFWLSHCDILSLMLWTWTTTIDISKWMLQQVSTRLRT